MPAFLRPFQVIAGSLAPFDSPARGFALVTGGRQSGHGLQGGVRYRADVGRQPGLSNRTDFALQALASNRGYTAATGEVEVARLAGAPLAAAFRGGWERRRHESFWGVGPDTLPGAEAAYMQDRLQAGGALWWMAGERGKVGGAVDLIDFDLGPPQDGGIDVADAFAPAGAAGLGLATRFLRWRAFADHDGRDAPGDPRSGSRWAAAFDVYADRRHERFDFRLLTLEAQHFVPFFNRKRVIAVRAIGELSAAADGQEIPFYLLPSLGGPDDHRGLDAFRYRGAHKLLVQTEYRWEAWVGLDMALFLDVGQVFDSASELDVDRLRTGYGLGLRFKSQEWMILRIDLAHGSEGFKPNVSFNRIF